MPMDLACRQFRRERAATLVGDFEDPKPSLLAAFRAAGASVAWKAPAFGLPIEVNPKRTIAGCST